MVSLVRLQCELLLWLHVLSSHLFHLWGKHCFWGCCGVDAVCLKVKMTGSVLFNTFSNCIFGGKTCDQSPCHLYTLMEMTKCPPFFRKLWAFSATILVWSGWATSAKMTSTIPKKTRETVNSLYNHMLDINRQLHGCIFWCAEAGGRYLPTSMRYLWGWRASSMMGIMLVLFFATFRRSRPDRWENSTAYTSPSCLHTIKTCHSHWWEHY